MIGIANIQGGENKNKLLKDLIASGNTYLFLVNQYVKVKDPLVFQHYKIVSDKTGFECMTVCGTEPSNDKPLYTQDPFVNYWRFPGTSFFFITKNAYEKSGGIDENFPEDTWELVELIHRVGNLGLTAPFGLFPTIKDEGRYFDVDRKKIEEGVARDLKRRDEIQKATDYWQSKNPVNFPNMGEPQKSPDKKIELKKGVGEI